MPTIERICITPTWEVSGLWDEVARHCHAWLAQHTLAVRDAVLLLPYSALLEPARAAFARAGGWQPRIETPLTLLESMAPPVPVAWGACSGDTVLDRMTAGTLLLRQAWAQDWLRRDPPGFERIVAAVVQAAQSLRIAAGERRPEDRRSFWDQARASVGTTSGPAATESLLLQVALEWAAASGDPVWAPLHAARPAAWIAVRLGGADAVAESLLGQGAVPSLLLDADPSEAAPFEAVSKREHLQRLVCEDLEDEAQAAASVVLEALAAGRAPVALVVLDRELVRRVQALLSRQQVPVVDETGWTLATTAAAGRLLGLLQAAQPGASRDDWLRWLKSWPLAEPRALESLEALWRGSRRVPGPTQAQALWERAQAHLQPLASASPQPLSNWLGLLQDHLEADGTLQEMTHDAAGAQVLAALHLSGEVPATWQQASATLRLSLSGLTAWVRSVLEESPFLPVPDDGAQVVVTPMSRAFGRPFAQVVIPGADHKHLGGADTAPSLISDSLAVKLGMDHQQARLHRQRLALAHVLRAPAVTLLRRHRDAEEPLTESAMVQWLLLARAQAQRPAWPLQRWQGRTRVHHVQPVPRPQPTAAQALPATLSATQLEALRDCPYRFFARAVLRLEPPDELDLALAKRDYGDWLHAVLHHFHSQRRPGEDDRLQLAAAADAVTRDQGLDAGELLPFRAGFDQLVTPYLAWLHEREARGWHWADGESDHRLALPQTLGVTLRGRLDRLDHGPQGAQQLLDYKTGALAELKKKVRQPLEDTQLMFYALLLGGGSQLGAAYLALDDEKAPLEVPHAEVHDSAQVLSDALADEWQRLREGAALPALGEGKVCETCESRGLCRRDHWPATGVAA